MEFVFLTGLGRAYYQANNVGKMLWLSKQVKDGDFEGGFQAFKAAGDEAAAIAAASGRQRPSRERAPGMALGAELRRHLALLRRRLLRSGPLPADLGAALRCVAQVAPVLDPPGEQVAIPYEGTTLNGFYFRGPGASGRRPLLIMNNGSDGSLLDMLTVGGAGALARGYDMLTFDGPGQGTRSGSRASTSGPTGRRSSPRSSTMRLTRDTVDPDRIALLGISQGGYWVPRAVAFEKRIAAAVADPGVVDVSTSWTAALPKELTDLLASGNKAGFDAAMEQGLPPAMKAGILFRMRPYGLSSYYDVFTAAATYNLTDVAGQITCPMLITAPDSEAFWPGQSERLYDLIKSPKTLVRFTAEEGADLHCEPKAYGLRDLRIFDWLDETLA